MVEDMKNEMERLEIEIGDALMEPKQPPGTTGERIKVLSNVYGVKMEEK
jgi:hypothetical protein